jgi:hypothetical protein
MDHEPFRSHHSEACSVASLACADRFLALIKTTREPMTKQCYQCGWEWKIGGQPGRSESCPECRSDLRVCLNCESYDSRSAHQCRDRRSEPVMEKERGNFCEYFEMTRKGTTEGKTKASDASERLKKLFGD